MSDYNNRAIKGFERSGVAEMVEGTKPALKAALCSKGKNPSTEFRLEELFNRAALNRAFLLPQVTRQTMHLNG